jgi:hypothetical protein
MAAAIVKPLGPTMQPTPKTTAPPKQREPGASPKRAGRFGLGMRIAISLLIAWHFTGVFLAALSLPPTSELVVNVAQYGPMQWYLDALYMNQAHSFFAPEVGPGHLIQYELFDQSGRVMDKGEFPKGLWPRLRYHRHFMLADQAGMPSDNQRVRDDWQRKYLECYAHHLLRINKDAQAVRVKRIAHWPLPRNYALDGRTLTDPEGYEMLMEVTQRRSDLPPEPNAQTQYQNQMWQSGGYQTAQPWMGTRR